MNPAMEPIVVTGFGVLACNGIGRESFWAALREGRSGIRTVSRFDPDRFPCRVAGQLWDFDPADFFRKAEIKRWHSHVHQSVASAQLAVDDAELDTARYAHERLAVGFGTSVGAPDEHYMAYREVYENDGWEKMSKYASSATSGHAATAHVSARFKLRGPATTIASGCSTGLDVIQWGVQQIRSGRADAAVVGATESPVTTLNFAAASALGILTQHNDEPEKAMRPFDRSSDGLVLSEGAAALVLERGDLARARGAQILGTVLGYGNCAEGNNPMLIGKSGDTLARAITQSFERAGISPGDVDCAHSHGVSLAMYDQSETNAYKKALGKHVYRVPITAIKSMMGQSYAASGLMGVGASLMSINENIIPGTLNLTDPRAECDLDFVPLKARRNDVNRALVTSMSFGGTHSALVLGNHAA